MSRTKKKVYRKSREVDSTCRNHGSCTFCEQNRLFNTRKKLSAINADEKSRLHEADIEYHGEDPAEYER